MFASYLGFAAVALLYTVVQARRFDGALNRLRSCVAQADTACTSAALEAARRIRSNDVRLELADASLGVLLHELDRATVTATTVENQQKQEGVSPSSDIRADLLLLRGDIASAKGNQTEARDDFRAAQSLVVDPSLITLRTSRLDAREDAAREHNTNELELLRGDFSDLFAAAQQGEHDITDLRISKAQEWTSRVVHLEARQELNLAIDAARRASSIVAAANRLAESSAMTDPPKPPVRGASDYSAGYYGSYEAQLSLYRDRLDRYNKARAVSAGHSAEASETSTAAIEQARQLLDKALVTLRGLPAPLSDASTSPTPTYAPGVVVRRVYTAYPSPFE
ncbi:MAG TPA: hypothetical protein VNW92_28850 [Polyangiaceae bacterium]|nr:hypothetical protein [Polyangiaceae bacterium]